MGKLLTVENPRLETEVLASHSAMRTVHIDQVKRWHDNPRTKPNPKRQEIKEYLYVSDIKLLLDISM